MSDLTSQAEPVVENWIEAEEDQLYERLGILDQAIQKDPEKKKFFDPEVTYNQAQMGAKEDVLNLGKSIYDRYAVEAYKLACDADDEDRKKLIAASGMSEVAIGGILAGLLISQLAVPAAFAPIIATIVVKRFFRPVYEDFCKVWKKNLPQDSAQSGGSPT